LGSDFDLVVIFETAIVPDTGIVPDNGIVQGQADIGCRKTSPISAVVCNDVFGGGRAGYYRRE
jgi:hypothetical protein